jgi:hypothetical protein
LDFEFQVWNERGADLTLPHAKGDPFFKEEDRRDAGPAPIAIPITAV